MELRLTLLQYSTVYGGAHCTSIVLLPALRKIITVSNISVYYFPSIFELGGSSINSAKQTILRKLTTQVRQRPQELSSPTKDPNSLHPLAALPTATVWFWQEYSPEKHLFSANHSIDCSWTDHYLGWSAPRTYWVRMGDRVGDCLASQYIASCYFLLEIKLGS